MKLYIYKSKSNTILYMAKTYRNSEGKSTSKIIERLGTLDEVKEKFNGEDPIVWAKKYIEEKNCLIENSNIENINVVNCYEFDEVKDEMNEIVEEHDNTLNTLGN